LIPSSHSFTAAILNQIDRLSTNDVESLLTKLKALKVAGVVPFITTPMALLVEDRIKVGSAEESHGVGCMRFF
jgi:hypothetical protein